LDADGETGLTFRTLAARLDTGAGAIYHHVANKSELLLTAALQVVTVVVNESDRGDTDREAIVSLALGIFDAVDARPWLGTQLARAPWPEATMLVVERLGRRASALGVPSATQFVGVSTLAYYILGAANQNAINRGLSTDLGDRQDFLDEMSAQWEALDPVEHAFTRSIAGQMREHDDREVFSAGIDLILGGMLSAA